MFSTFFGIDSSLLFSNILNSPVLFKSFFIVFVISFVAYLLPSKLINATEYGLSEPFVISNTNSEIIGCASNMESIKYFFIQD